MKNQENAQVAEYKPVYTNKNILILIANSFFRNTYVILCVMLSVLLSI